MHFMILNLRREIVSICRVYCQNWNDTVGELLKMISSWCSYFVKELIVATDGRKEVEFRRFMVKSFQSAKYFREVEATKYCWSYLVIDLVMTMSAVSIDGVRGGG